MKVLVTGGTGFLGNNIVRKLVERGDRVAVLVRDQPPAGVFDALDVELVRGGLTDETVIDNAVANCDAVIHSAALIHLGWSRMEESLRANRDGTATIAEAARRHRRRMALIATVSTLPLCRDLSRSSIVDEETPLDATNDQIPCAYVVSKRASVAEVTRRLDAGLDAVIVHPGFMLGPWDWKPSSGRMVLALRDRFIPHCPTGGCSVCDVRDVADGVLAAIDRGTRGKHYILAGHNVRYRELWGELAMRLGRRSPVLPLGPLARALGGGVGAIASRWSGEESELNSAALTLSSQLHWYNSALARDELGYSNRPMGLTLDDAVTWVNANFPKKKS
jgi:dihydroflavonol-4-reductase